MNELIKIKNENNRQFVNARELYEFLEAGQEFATWIKGRISKYDFIEGEDFTIDKFINGKATQKDYIITIDMAKEVAMVENNGKGKEARKYFIECEKQAKSTQPKLSKEVQAIFVLDARTVKIENKVTDMENNMPLFNVECKELQALVRKIGTKSLGGYRSPAYNDKSIRTKIYKDIQHQLKREFGIIRYEGIKRVQLAAAREIVTNYRVPLFLHDDILILNEQTDLFKG